MNFPNDVSSFVSSRFPKSEQMEAYSLLSEAFIERGGQSPARLLRCAAFASDGSLVTLKYYVSLLKIDWRDVIVAGEYELQGKDLVRVRDLNQPLQV